MNIFCQPPILLIQAKGNLHPLLYQ